MWRNSETSYGLVSIVLHWIVAILFLCQLPLGYLTQASEHRPALQFELYQWHKSVGFLLLAIAVPRLLWAIFNRSPQLPESVSESERSAARLGQIALYASTVLVPLAGWAVVSTSPLDIPSYVFNLVVVPNLPMTPSDAAEAFWSTVHAFLAYAAGFLAAVHMLAALRHHFHFGDEVLLRMLRPSPGRRTRPAPAPRAVGSRADAPLARRRAWSTRLAKREDRAGKGAVRYRVMAEREPRAPVPSVRGTCPGS